MINNFNGDVNWAYQIVSEKKEGAPYRITLSTLFGRAGQYGAFVYTSPALYYMRKTKEFELYTLSTKKKNLLTTNDVLAYEHFIRVQWGKLVDKSGNTIRGDRVKPGNEPDWFVLGVLTELFASQSKL